MDYQKQRPRRYPWDEWFRSKRFTLIRGTHYFVRTDLILQQVRAQGTRRGVSLRVVVADDQQAIAVEVLPKRARKRGVPQR